MQLLRKLVILNAVKGTGKGVIKLEALGEKVKGLINISEPKGIELRMGIRIGFSRLYEYDILSNNYDFSLDDGMNLNEKIECVIINSYTHEPLLYGSSDGRSINIDRLCELMTKDRNLFKETSEIYETVKEVPQPISETIAENDIPKITIVDLGESKEKECAATVDKEKEHSKSVEKEPDEDFFETIKPQLDELFKCYPADKDLMRSVPDSKWVRVDYDKDEFYVVGILYNGTRATHICYGVPGEYSVRPKQKSEWLPLDYMDPEGKGYWVIFQDALTGKTID